MTMATLQFDLEKPDEKLVFDAASKGWKYRQLIRTLLEELVSVAGDDKIGQHRMSVAHRIAALGVENGLLDVREYLYFLRSKHIVPI